MANTKIKTRINICDGLDITEFQRRPNVWDNFTFEIWTVCINCIAAAVPLTWLWWAITYFLQFVKKKSEVCTSVCTSCAHLVQNVTRVALRKYRKRIMVILDCIKGGDNNDEVCCISPGTEAVLCNILL